ncbi:MAG: hypothetical protein KKA35_04485, partial [Proteobacteria bacterium]|nr:hypothetical protein [Pseudomonadota bacterium]
QILEVRGFADRKLRLPDKPLDFSNRRVSILLPLSVTDKKGANDQDSTVIVPNHVVSQIDNPVNVNFDGIVKVHQQGGGG